MSVSDDAPVMAPWNLALRFVLEVACVAGIAAGVAAATPSLVWLAAAVATTALWVTFATPGDPSRSGRAPVPTPGSARLALELAIFGGGVVGWLARGQTAVAAAIAVLIVIHHAASRDRLIWLLSPR